MRFLIFYTFLIILSTLPGKEKIPADRQPTKTFTPLDTSFKFSVDPKEIDKVKAADAETLKEKVDFVKDKVLDSKSKLMEISKQRYVTDIPISYLTVEHKNDMGSRYNTMSLTYILDGKRIFCEYDLEKFKRDRFSIYNSVITPGYHEIVVQTIYSGNTEGVFKYLSDYQVKVQKRFPFVIKSGRKLVIEGVACKKGGIFTSFKDRPAIEFNTKEISRIAAKSKK